MSLANSAQIDSGEVSKAFDLFFAAQLHCQGLFELEDGLSAQAVEPWR